MVYTCSNQSCVIKCPCHVCRAPRGDCCQSRQSRLNCKACSPQCSLHQITVPFMFNPSQNLYTIITENMSKYRYAHGYAGIPKSCEHCVSDLLEHQVLHLVIHEFCRYCRFESRPLEYKKASRSLKSLFKQKRKQILEMKEPVVYVCSNSKIEMVAKFTKRLFTGRLLKSLSVNNVPSLLSVKAR